MRGQYSLSTLSLYSPEPSLTLPALLSPKHSRCGSNQPESPSLRWDELGNHSQTLERLSPVRSGKQLPSDSDFQRLISRLEQVVSGSELRGFVLVAGKTVRLELAIGEWQYLKVKAAGLPSPLTVVLKRTKGRVASYASLSVPEPDHQSCDFASRTDRFLVTAHGPRFKTKWIFLGLHCIEQAVFTLTVRVAPVKKGKSADYSKPQGLMELAELRKDAEKRKALFQRVESILAVRKEKMLQKCSNRDFVRENKTLRTEEELGAKREAETLRREEALRRYEAALNRKKQRALLQLNKQETKRLQEALAEDAQSRVEEVQACLRAAVCAGAAEALWEVLVQHKEEPSGVTLVANAMVRRYVRRMSQATSLKRQTKELLLNHLTLYTASVFPVCLVTTRMTLFAVIRSNAEAHKAKCAFDEYVNKGDI